MVWISSFRGLLYNQEKIENFSQVVAPPYDIISPESQEGYYQKNPYNVIRLILNKQFPTDTDLNNRYTRSAETFKEWLSNKVLIESCEPALYLLEETYMYQNNLITRKGFIAIMRLEDFRLQEHKQVLPHERTHSKAKIDRLNLMRNCKANFCQIFGLYSDPTYSIIKALEQEARDKPLIDILDEDGIRHSLWAITEPSVIETVIEIMKDKSVIIADGHHRYETALNFSKEMAKKNPAHTGQEPYNWVMFYLANTEDKGTIILPTHRLVKNISLNVKLMEKIEDFFTIEKIQDLKTMLALMKKDTDKHIFGMYCGNNDYYLLRLRDIRAMDTLLSENKSSAWKTLDVSILQIILINYILQIKNIETDLSYTKDETDAIKLVEAGQYQLAFFLNPTRINQLQEVTTAGELMPQKSTYFYPKLLSGLVINRL